MKPDTVVRWHRQGFKIDFFTVPTVTFRVLYCFVVLRHDRRHIVHFHVTARERIYRSIETCPCRVKSNRPHRATSSPLAGLLRPHITAYTRAA